MLQIETTPEKSTESKDPLGFYSTTTASHFSPVGSNSVREDISLGGEDQNTGLFFLPTCGYLLVGRSNHQLFHSPQFHISSSIKAKNG